MSSHVNRKHSSHKPTTKIEPTAVSFLELHGGAAITSADLSAAPGGSSEDEEFVCSIGAASRGLVEVALGRCAQVLSQPISHPPFLGVAFLALRKG